MLAEVYGGPLDGDQVQVWHDRAGEVLYVSSELVATGAEEQVRPFWHLYRLEWRTEGVWLEYEGTEWQS